MTTLLAKQVAAFKQQHGITAVGAKRQTAPSILFSPQEAKTHDPESFAALALHGLSEASILEPKLSQFSDLFEGSMRDRDLLTKEENGVIDQKIRKFLLLLSPHLQARAAQECVEGLLQRYHAHRWNVDDIMAAALPHHDSPLFTKLIQGLHVENRPRWAWLSTLKAKPATLIRSTLAKYCSKDTAVLAFVGDVLEETLQLQLQNRALMTFFVAIWLDTIALSVGNDLVQVAIQSILKLLTQPAQQDAFYAGVTVAGALCAKIQLEESVQGQLLVRLAKQAVGEDGRAAFSLMAEMTQLQELEKLPQGVVKVLAKHGPEELLLAPSSSVDAGNLLAMLVKAALLAEEENAQALAQRILEDGKLLRCYAPQLCRAVLQAFLECLSGAATAKARKKIVARFQAAAKCLGSAPLALGEAMRQELGAAAPEAAETLVQLLAPACATISEGEDRFMPAVQAFSHKLPKVRSKAVISAAASLEDSEGAAERQQLLGSMALHALEDENVEVVATALRQQALWVSDKVPPSATVSALISALSRLVKNPKQQKSQTLFHSLFLEDGRARKLLPLMIQAAAWVKSRKDLTELQQRLEAKLLPLLLVALLGLDEVEEEAVTKDLQPAVLAFCEVSQEQLLQQVSVETEATETLGPLGSSVLQAIDVAGALRLCELLAGCEVPVLGGLAAQASAGRLLQAALPSLMETLKSTRPKALDLLMRSVEACERFAESLSSGDWSLLKGVWKATLEAAASMATPAPRRKSRGSQGAPSAPGENREAIQRLMRLALRKPKDLAADLQGVLTQESFQPALITLALGPAEKGVASANAMLMLKSLVAKKGWSLDQNLLALIMAKIAGAQELEVRAAAVAFLKVLKDSQMDDSLEATLVEAKLLKAKSAVLPEKAWSSVTTELSKDQWSSMVDLLLKNEKEMLQDRGAAALAISKLYSKGGLPKAQRSEVLNFTMVSLARCEDEAVDLLLTALPVTAALQSVKELLGKSISELSKKGAPNQAFSLLALAMKVMIQGSEKSKAQEAVADTARSVVFPLCLALAKSCESEVPTWEPCMVNLAIATCRVAGRLATSEVVQEAISSLFRFTVALRGLAPKMSETTSIAPVVAAASSALAEVPSDAETLQLLLKSEPLQGKRLKESQGEAAAQLIYEQVLGLPASGPRSKLLVALANTAKEAGKHLPKDSDANGGAVVHILMAVAALSEQLAKDVEASEATEVAEAVPTVCQAIDEASGSCLEPCLPSLIRCCGALTMLAAADDSTPLKLVEKSLSKVKQLRPDALALLKGNMKKLWRSPEAADWKVPQARLRGLLHHTFRVIEVSKLNALALASSSGSRLGLDFSILLLLVHRSSQEKPSLPKKKRRKKRSDPVNEELDEVVEALTAPSDEDLLLDEVYEMLTSPEPSDRYNAFGMFLLSLAAWSAKMRSCEVPWAALLPDEVMSELDEDACFKILRQGIQLASRFLSEHGLPDQLDREEVDASTLLDMYQEKEGDIALALVHGLRALCIIEALLTQTPGQGREEVQCRKQTQDLQGLMLRSLSVNHPVTFFRGLCLSLGVKGKAPKGNASTLLADQDFVSHLSSRVMSAAAKALSDRRDLRPDEEMEGEEGGAENCEAAIQHVCKRFLSGADHDEMATAWELLDEICRFSQQHASGSILTSALPKAGTFLGALQQPDEAATKAAVKCCQCVETMVSTLGHGILPGLKEICQPLLDLALQAIESSFELDLDASVLSALAALCRSVGAMLSPFLGKFLQVVCAPGTMARTQLLQSLGRDLVEGVPHRLLLKEVQKSSVDPFKEGTMESDEAMIRSQRLSTFYLWILLKATPEFVAAQDLMPGILRLFGCSSSSVKAFLATGADAQEIPVRLLKRGTSASFITSAAIQDLSWSNVAQDASLQGLQMLGGACFARFCLFLEPDDVKTRISKVLDWARGKQDKILAKPKTEVKDEDASKTLALLASLSTLAAEAEGLGEELLMPLANKDVASALKAAQSSALRLAREKLPRKKRRTASGARSEKEVLTNLSWWWYDVALACLNFLALVFRQGSKSGAESKIWEESFEELMEPSVAILDLFEFLAPDDAISGGLSRALQPAVVAMTSACAEDGVKRMMQAILEKTRSEDSEVTLMAVKCAHRIWSDLGVQVVMSLSEVVMYTSELQDHEDSRVEAEVKALVRTIEECTGESLHDAMKT